MTTIFRVVSSCDFELRQARRQRAASTRGRPDRQADREGGASVGAGLDLDGSTVQSHDGLHDGEAQAGALDGLLGGGRGPEEAGEQPALLGVGNAEPGVGDDQRRLVVVGGEAQLDPAAVRGELDGVREQVDQHPLELVRVHVELDGVVGHVDDDIQRPVVEQPTDRVVSAGDDVAEVGGNGVDVQRRRLDLRVLEEVLDQAQQPVAVAVDAIHQAELGLVEVTDRAVLPAARGSR